MLTQEQELFIVNSYNIYVAQLAIDNKILELDKFRSSLQSQGDGKEVIETKSQKLLDEYNTLKADLDLLSKV